MDIDSDGGGSVSIAELITSMTENRSFSRMLQRTPKKLKFEDIDSDGSGSIDLAEFTDMVLGLMYQASSR